MSLRKTIFSGAAVISLIAGAAAFTGSAHADMIEIKLDQGNFSGHPGPYADVTVNRIDGTHAIITFTSLTHTPDIYLLGGQGSVAVNVNATSWTFSSLSGANVTGFTPGPWSDGGSGNEDGFGAFNQKITSFDGYTHSSDKITFTLTDTGGTWADAANVLAANASGYLAAAHVFVTSSPAGASNGAVVTGYAAGNSIIAVPEPATWATTLVGFAFLGYAAFHRARKESVSALA
jgi:hypothetical protein